MAYIEYAALPFRYYLELADKALWLTRESLTSSRITALRRSNVGRIPQYFAIFFGLINIVIVIVIIRIDLVISIDVLVI